MVERLCIELALYVQSSQFYEFQKIVQAVGSLPYNMKLHECSPKIDNKA